MTLATLPIDPSEVSRFGVVEVAKNGDVIGFDEKPKTTNMRSPFNPDMVDASMGIYIFNTDVLLPALMKDAEDPDSKHDFGHNILPSILGQYKMTAYNFVDENKKQALYWRDVGTLDAYYDANMDLVSVSPVFNLYDNELGDAHPAAAVSSGQVRIRRTGSYGHGYQFGHLARLHYFGCGGAEQYSVAGCARELVCGHRLEHHFHAHQYRPALPDQAGDY